MLKFAALSSALALSLTLAAPAAADITARFIESAPKDRFIVQNAGACAQTDLTLEIDLSSSTAGLIFDVTSTGAGVEVFQPFELIAGGGLVSPRPTVTDGMNSVTLSIPTFPAGAEIIFTVDVDDTAPASDLGQIRVSGSEIAGAMLKANGDQAGFGQDGMARLTRDPCNA